MIVPKAKLMAVALAALVAVGLGALAAQPAQAWENGHASGAYLSLGHLFYGLGYGYGRGYGYSYGHGYGYGHGSHAYRPRHRHGSHHHGSAYGYGGGVSSEGDYGEGRDRDRDRGYVAEDSSCQRVSKWGRDDYGRRIRIAGTMCTDAYGASYIVPGSRYVVTRY